MKKRETYKLKWAALLLAAALAVGIAPAWAEETDTAELAVSVSGQTVTFTLYAEEFDAAGFCVSGAVNAAAAEGFTAVTCRQGGGTLELVVRAERPVSASGGVVIATAELAGDQVAFATGSDAYLEGRSAVAYNGYRTLEVSTVTGTPLWRVKSDAVGDLTDYIQEKADAGVTVAQRELLAQCLQSGRAAIHNAGSSDAVAEKLAAAMARADEIAAESGLDFPRLLTLEGAELGDNGTLREIYPAFAPETTTYFIANARPRDSVRRFRGTVASGVSVRFNGESVAVSGGAFTFDVPFRTTESMSALVLTDGRTGLSTTYLFCSATSQTRGSSIDDIHVCDADGREKDGTIGEITANGTVLQLTTYEQTVRIGFTGTASANTEFYTEMRVDNVKTQEFTGAAGSEALTETYLSKPITLHEGLNWVLLRCRGTDSSKWVDGKAETVEAYVTRAVLITYIDPEKADPAAMDTQLDGIHIYFDGSESTERFTAFDPETREYDVTLQAADMLFGLQKQYIHMTVEAREGQTVTVFGGSEIQQNRKLLEDGYHIATYTAMNVAMNDSFPVVITVTAADNVHKDTYTLNVVKKGTCAIVVPQIYRNGETLITGTDPLKEQWLTLASVGISDKDGNRVDTGTAAAEGALTIEISDTEVLSWTGKTSSGNFSVVPHKAGKVIITLIYDDGNGTRIEEPIEHAVNYTDSYLRALVSQAEELLRNEEGRKYAEGAAETLQQALTEQRAVLSKVNGMSRDSMTDAQKQSLNDAAEALTQAMADFRGAEIGLEVTEFAPLAEDVAEQTVAYDTKREELNLPSTLRARIDGQWVSISGVTWDSMPEYPSDYKYKYQFTARLPKGYKTASGVELPTIAVTRKAEVTTYPVTPSKWVYPAGVEGGVLAVPMGTALADITQLCMWVRETQQGNVYYVPTPTAWEDLSGFDGSRAGQYIFRATLKEGQEDDQSRVFQWRDGTADSQKSKEMTVVVYDLTPPGDMQLTVGESAGLQVQERDYAVNAAAMSRTPGQGETKQTVGEAIQWTSADPEVAAVTGARVTAGKAGTAVLTGEVQGTALRVQCTVTVTDPNAPAEPGESGGSDQVNGALNGQTTTGGTYEDLLVTGGSNKTDVKAETKPQPSGSTGSTDNRTSTAADRAPVSTPAESGGTETGGDKPQQVVRVSKADTQGETDAVSPVELAILLASGALLLTVGVLRGRRRGEG